MKGSGPQGPPAFVPHTTANSMEPVNWATPTPWAAERALGQQGISSWGSVGGGLHQGHPGAHPVLPAIPLRSEEGRQEKTAQVTTQCSLGQTPLGAARGKGSQGKPGSPVALAPRVIPRPRQGSTAWTVDSSHPGSKTGMCRTLSPPPQHSLSSWGTTSRAPPLLDAGLWVRRKISSQEKEMR